MHIISRSQKIFLHILLWLGFGIFLLGSFVVWQYAISFYGVTDVVALYIRISALTVSVVVFALVYNVIFHILNKFSLAEEIVDTFTQSKDRFSLAISATDEGLWDFDLTTKKASVSLQWGKMFGVDGGITELSQWQNMIHPEDKEAVLSAFSYHIDGHTPFYTAQYRMKTKGDSYVWVRDRGMVVRNKSGEAVRMAGSTRDVSNIKQVEDVLKARTEELEKAKDIIEEEARNTRKFKQAVDASTDAITIALPTGEIIYTNNAWEKLTGFSFSGANTKQFTFIYEQNTDKDILSAMRKTLKGGNSFINDDIVGLRKDGSTYQAEISVFPVMDKGKVLFYTTLEEDITKRKQIDRAKTEFVSLASHQLRTPLSAIRWYTELLAKPEQKLTAQQKKYADGIYTAVKRMINLVDTFLNVSRIDLGTFTLTMSSVNLRDIIDKSLLDLSSDIKDKKLSIKSDYDSNISSVHSDARLLRIVFDNLLSNAVKYTPEGGSISIALENKESGVKFSISDTGYGIPTHQQNRIFEKMFRADNVKEVNQDGNGIGLYLVKAIMNKMGGSIEFTSPTPNQKDKEHPGAVFYGILPVKVQTVQDTGLLQ